MSLSSITWEWDRMTIGPGGVIRSQREARQLIELIEILAKMLPEEHSVAEIVHNHAKRAKDQAA